MPFDYSIVNAFTTTSPHSGNQASVVILSSPRSDTYKSLLARDFNFSETAFVEPIAASASAGAGGEGRWSLRWFTPETEVELCGHATLAAAAVLFEREPDRNTLYFETRWAGELKAERKGAEGIEISLPTIKQDALDKLEDEALMLQHKEGALSALSEAMPEIQAQDVVRVFKDPWGGGGGESCIIELAGTVNLKELKVDARHMLNVSRGMNMVTQVAPSSEPNLHINTRVFVPGAGVDEDPVTGSAHAYLAGYFNSPSIRSTLLADPSIIIGAQLSQRGGALVCRKDGGMVRITGKASIWASGTLRGD